VLPIIEAYFHPVNKNLTPPDLNQTVWRIMRLGRFEQLIEHRGLWFARFDEMEDKEECRIPEKNLRPTIDALISAGIPVHMAHAEGMREVAGKAFWARHAGKALQPHQLLVFGRATVGGAVDALASRLPGYTRLGPGKPNRRVGTDPDTGERVDLRRSVTQDLEDAIHEIWHGFVP
jgi:hypothetical protein